MNHRRHAFLSKASTQPADLSGFHSERLGGCRHIQDSSFQAGQDLYFALLFGVQGYCPHTLKYAVIFPEQLKRSFSLSSNKKAPEH
jgi:hypothetical protein